MTITKGNGKYILLSDDSYILHTETSAEAMREYTEKNFAGNLDKITEDFSQLYADERGTYITEKQLEAEFSAMSEEERDGRTAAEYISDCTDQDGTLFAI